MPSAYVDNSTHVVTVCYFPRRTCIKVTLRCSFVTTCGDVCLRCIYLGHWWIITQRQIVWHVIHVFPYYLPLLCITVFCFTYYYLCLEYLLLTRICIYHKYLKHGQKRRYIMTSNGNIFRVTGPLCGEFTGHRWIPAQRPVTQSFDVFFRLCLGKQSWGWWFETPSRSLWRHCNDSILWDVIICTFSDYPLLPLNFLHDSLRFLKKASKCVQHLSRARRNNGTQYSGMAIRMYAQQSRKSHGKFQSKQKSGKSPGFWYRKGNIQKLKNKSGKISEFFVRCRLLSTN